MKPYGEVFLLLFLSHLLQSNELNKMLFWWSELSLDKNDMPFAASPKWGEFLKGPPIYFFAYLDLLPWPLPLNPWPPRWGGKLGLLKYGLLFRHLPHHPSSFHCQSYTTHRRYLNRAPYLGFNFYVPSTLERISCSISLLPPSTSSSGCHLRVGFGGGVRWKLPDAVGNSLHWWSALSLHLR